MTASTSMRSGPAARRTRGARPRRGARSRARRRARGCRRRRPPRPTRPARAPRSRRRRPAVTSPGASATCTMHSACARSRARRTWSPRPAPRCIGASWPATDDSPTAPGSAKVTNSSHSASWRHRARAPTKRSRLTATSTSARSGSCPGRSTTSAASRTQRVIARAAGGHQAGGDAGHRGLAHLGEDVVGAGRERADRHVAARLGHDAVGAVAAEDDDRGDAPRAHLLDGARAVGGARGQPHVELLEGREGEASVVGARRAPRELAVQRGRQPVAGRHHEHALDARGAEPGEQPVDHPGLVGVAEHRRAGDQPADVAPRGRVGDDPDTRARGHALQATPGGPTRLTSPAASMCGEWPLPSSTCTSALSRGRGGRARAG